MTARPGSPARGRLRPLLGWVLVAATGMALWASGAGAAAQDTGRDPREAPGQAAALLRGADVYSSQCATCHGAAGQGGRTPSGAEAPALRGVPYALVDLVTRTGRMPPGDADGDEKGPRALADERRESLLTWMDSQLELSGGLPEVRLGGGNPARGQEVYAANCAQCHGSTGGGGVAGGGAFTPVLVDRDPLVLAEAIRLGPFQMPQFGEEVISDRELADVIAFLEEVRGEPGTPIGLVELNPVFAGAFVFAIALAAIFSAMWLAGRVAMFPDRPAPHGAASEGAAEAEPEAKP